MTYFQISLYYFTYSQRGQFQIYTWWTVEICLQNFIKATISSLCVINTQSIASFKTIHYYFFKTSNYSHNQLILSA